MKNHKRKTRTSSAKQTFNQLINKEPRKQNSPSISYLSYIELEWTFYKYPIWDLNKTTKSLVKNQSQTLTGCYQNQTLQEPIETEKQGTPRRVAMNKQTDKQTKEAITFEKWVTLPWGKNPRKGWSFKWLLWLNTVLQLQLQLKLSGLCTCKATSITVFFLF